MVRALGMVWLGVMAQGCVDPSGDQGPAQQTAQNPTPCSIPGIPAILEVSQGGRAVVPFTTVPADAPVSVQTAPAGWTVTTADQELRIKVPYSAAGSSPVTLSVLCRGTPQAVPVDVTVRALAWEALPTWRPAQNGPLAREYFALWVDEADPDRLLLFGGFHYVPAQFTPANDLWEYNLATNVWTEVQPTTPAPYLPGGRSAPVPGARAILYYGGTAPSDTPYSLKRLEYAPGVMRWTDEPVARAPSVGAYTGAFIFDEVNERYVSACGASSGVGYHCQVSTFITNGTQGIWQRETPAGETPTGRNGFFYAYDKETQRLIMFSGDQGGEGWAGDMAQDTWALELGESPMRWVKLLDAQDPLLGRRNGAYVLDPVNHRLLVWGGTPDGADSFPGLYALDLDRGHERWDLVPTTNQAPGRTSAMGVYDAARQRFLFGFGNDDALYADLWALNL